MDRIEIDEDSEAAEDSELTLEIFIILAVDEELVVVNIGAGGKGNIVFEEDLEANCAGGGVKDAAGGAKGACFCVSVCPKR